MIISSAVEKMINFYEGNLHDIAHFMKVWAFAKTIGEQEKLDAHTMQILELAAVVHDIACPLCREKYGNTNGKNQEIEGPPLVKAFLSDLPVSTQDTERISWLVAHHHTYENVDGLDYQILLEADFIVNAEESGFKYSAVESAKKNIFKTTTGIRLLQSIYLQSECIHKRGV